MPKGVRNKRYTPEFKKLVVKTMQKERISYRETARQFEISDDKRVAVWEQIYLEEGPKGFAIDTLCNEISTLCWAVALHAVFSQFVA